MDIPVEKTFEINGRLGLPGLYTKKSYEQSLLINNFANQFLYLMNTLVPFQFGVVKV